MSSSAVRRVRARCLLGAGAALSTALLVGTPALADELQYRLAVDVPVTSVAEALLVTTQALEGKLAPSTCRWCGTRADGTDDVNVLDRSVRSALRWSNPDTADAASAATGFVMTPAFAFGLDAVAAGHDSRLREAPVNSLLILEATLLAANVNQVVKFLAGRERPFVHALPPGEKTRTAHPADNNVSFYSGHTNLVFSLAVASGTVASLRGYRMAPVVWTGGLGLATLTGFLRIAADRHYFTDVLVGAVMGSAIGFAVPFFFHPRTDAATTGSATSALEPTAAGTGGSQWVGFGGTF